MMMNVADALAPYLPVLGLLFIVLLFVAFAVERFPPVTIAVCGAALMSAGVSQPNAIISACLLYTSPSPRDRTRSRMPSSA